MQSAALGALAQKLGLRADPIRVGAWAKSSDDRTVWDLIVRENAGLRVTCVALQQRGRACSGETGSAVEVAVAAASPSCPCHRLNRFVSKRSLVAVFSAR